MRVPEEHFIINNNSSYIKAIIHLPEIALRLFSYGKGRMVVCTTTELFPFPFCITPLRL
jgi:hypothetical protein